MSISPVLIKDIKSVGICNLVLNLFTNIAFLISGHWDITVLVGSAFGYILSMIVFIMLAFSLEKTVDKDPKSSQLYMQSTYMGRMFVMGIGLYLSMTLTSVNWIAVCIALVYTRVSIMIISFLRKRKEEKNGEYSN